MNPPRPPPPRPPPSAPTRRAAPPPPPSLSTQDPPRPPPPPLLSTQRKDVDIEPVKSGLVPPGPPINIKPPGPPPRPTPPTPPGSNTKLSPPSADNSNTTTSPGPSPVSSPNPSTPPQSSPIEPPAAPPSKVTAPVKSNPPKPPVASVQSPPSPVQSKPPPIVKTEATAPAVFSAPVSVVTTATTMIHSKEYDYIQKTIAIKKTTNKLKWLKDKDTIYALVEDVSDSSNSSKGMNKTAAKSNGLVDELVTIKYCIDTSKPNAAVMKDDLYAVNMNVSEDMTSLAYLTEPTILYNLQERYLQHQIYTNMGSVLIAINPYKHIPMPSMQSYIQNNNSGGNNALTTPAPHPYTVAEICYQNLVIFGKPQSMVIGGESGAGKTETAKIVLQYLAERYSVANTSSASTGAQQRRSTVGAASSGLRELEIYSKLIQISPILESFGNAKTVRNHNSSRFGKYMKLLYAPSSSSTNAAPSMKLIGGMIETYLLEKSRVISQSNNEQNYHIFYLLLQNLFSAFSGTNSSSSSTTRGKKNMYHAAKEIEFRIARGSGLVKGSKNTINNTIIDYSQFFFSWKEILQSFETLQFSEQQIEEIWKILLGLLYLGNLEFEQQETREGNIASISKQPDANGYTGEEYLEFVVECFGLQESEDKDVLRNILTQRIMETRNETFVVKYTVTEARSTRDAIVKCLYDKLFAYLISSINETLVPASASTSKDFIGILDIFGFENFVVNQFEQLLINYTNEILQSLFNECIFQNELALFQQEQLDLPPIVLMFDLDGNEIIPVSSVKFKKEDLPYNQACVDLMYSRSESSILSILDTFARQSMMSTGGDSSSGSGKNSGKSGTSNETALDEKFCEELHKTFQSTGAAAAAAVAAAVAAGNDKKKEKKREDYFLPISKKDYKHYFQIQHYANAVKYSISMNTSSASNNSAAAAPAVTMDSWIVKNVDPVPDSLELLYSATEFSVLEAFATVNTNISEKAGGAGSKRRKSMFMKPTLVTIFQANMQSLVHTLQATTIQFIRCLKPNTTMVSFQWNTNYIIEQVQSLGIVQTCEILSIGLPSRLPYEQVLSWFPNTLIEYITDCFDLFRPKGIKFDSPSSSAYFDGSLNEKLMIAIGLSGGYGNEISSESYRLGNSMIFFPSGQLPVVQQLLLSSHQSANSSTRQGNVQAFIKSFYATIQTWQATEKKLIEFQTSSLVTLKNFIEHLSEEIYQILSQLEDDEEEDDDDDQKEGGKGLGLELPSHIVDQLTKIERLKSSIFEYDKQYMKQKLLLTKKYTILEQMTTQNGADYISSARAVGVKSNALRRQVNETYQIVAQLYESYVQRYSKEYQELQKQLKGVSEDIHETIRSLEKDYLHIQSTIYTGLHTKLKESSCNISEQFHQPVDKLLTTIIPIGYQYLSRGYSNEVNKALTSTVTKQVDEYVHAYEAAMTKLEQLEDEFHDTDKSIQSQISYDAIEILLSKALTEIATELREEEKDIHGIFEELMEKVAEFEHKKNEFDSAVEADRKELELLAEQEKLRALKLAEETAAKEAAAQKEATHKEAAQKEAVQKKALDKQAADKQAAAATVATTVESISVAADNSVSTSDSTTPFTTKNTKNYNFKDLAAMKKRNSVASSASEDTTTTTTTSTSVTITTTATEESAAVVTPLPSNWKELFDSKSQRPYYVNKITKERQWKRPEADPVSVPSAPSPAPSTVASSITEKTVVANPAAAAAPSTAAGPGEKPVKPTRKIPSSTTTTATTTAAVAGEEVSTLPAGWREILDKKTNRNYYVNEVTKARQWKRPTEPAILTEENMETNPADATATTAAVTTHHAASSAASSSTDISSTLSPTKINIVDNYRQSKRFSSIRLTDTSGVTIPVNEQQTNHQQDAPEDETEKAEKAAAVTRAAARASLRLSRIMLASEGTPTQHHPPTSSATAAAAASTSSTTNTNNTSVMKGTKYFATQRIQQSRDRYDYVVDTMSLCHTEAEWEAELGAFKQTIPYLYAFGQKKYTGYLSKQSKLLGRWKKRFFLLEEDCLFYLDSEKEYQQLITKYGAKEWKEKVKSDKKLLLTDQTLASYTTTPNCLSITTSIHAKDMTNDELTWFLLADNDDAMENWLVAINSHIHYSYVNHHALHGEDYWDKVPSQLTLWKVPYTNNATSQRRPVGVRSIPSSDAPRTGEGLFAGEVVEVNQIIGDPSRKQTYLRLADERGWVFEYHPMGSYPIMIPAGGKVVEHAHTYVYSAADQDAAVLPIYMAPHCAPDSITDSTIQPGEEFDGCAEWLIAQNLFTTNSIHHQIENYEDDYQGVMLCFIKLADNRGWVESVHRVTGDSYVQRVA